MPATSFQADWKVLKDNFIKTARGVPPEISMLVSQGTGFGPALKAFDGASTPEARSKAMASVVKAKDGYEKDLGIAIKATESKVGRQGMKAFLSQIDALMIRVNEAAQPPRPSGKMVPALTLRQFDLAAGVKPVYFKVDPILVTAHFEVDSEFKKLMDAGEAGLRMEDLGDAAMKELVGLKDAFQATIMKVDRTIAADMTLLAGKTKEANEVLQHYGKIVTDNISRAVETEWAKYLARRKDLHEFRVKSAVKITLGTIGVAVAVTSVAMSFGTAWMNIAAACKGFVDVAKSIKTWAEDIDDVYAKLNADMDEITKINDKRAKSGTTKSKVKQAGKEVASAALPFAKDMIQATSTMEARCKQFSGLISKLESSEDTLSGKIEIISKNLNSLPDRFLDTTQINLNRRAGKAVADLIKQAQDLHRSVKNAIRFSEAATKSVKKLKDSDSWVTGTATAGGVGTKAVAVFALVNFIVECAKHGTSIVKLLPI